MFSQSCSSFLSVPELYAKKIPHKMETGSIALGVFLFLAAEFIKFALNMVINLFQKDEKDAVKVTERKKKMPAFLGDECRRIERDSSRCWFTKRS